MNRDLTTLGGLRTFLAAQTDLPSNTPVGCSWDQGTEALTFFSDVERPKTKNGQQTLLLVFSQGRDDLPLADGPDEGAPSKDPLPLVTFEEALEAANAALESLLFRCESDLARAVVENLLDSQQHLDPDAFKG